MRIQEVEAAVCGMVMRDPKALAQAVERGLHPRHFQDPLCSEIYSGCLKAWKDGQEADLVTVCHHVGHDKLTEVKRLRSQAPLTQNVAAYLTAVMDGAKQLEIETKLTDISRALTSRKAMDSLEPVMEKLADLVSHGKLSANGLKTTTIQQALDRSLESLQERLELSKSGLPPGIPSGLDLLDRYTYGFQPGFMYVLGARTSVGKTTMAVNMALGAARAGHKVAFITVEMSDSDIADKMISRVSRTDMSKLLSGKIEKDIDRIQDGVSELAKLPIVFVEVIKPRLDLLAFEALRLVRVEGVKLIIVDYLQLFEVGDEKRSRTARDEVKTVSAQLKGLARQLKTPLLVLSQLNRQAPEEGEPELIHIAETDGIARDADVVLFLFRFRGEYFISIAKQRRGSKKAFRLNAELQYSLFDKPSEAKFGGR